jgi:hypothetical protein
MLRKFCSCLQQESWLPMSEALMRIAFAAGVLLLAIAPGAAAPMRLSHPATPPDVIVAVQCRLTGYDWSAAGLAGGLRPGILAVGGYYNSLSYGYSGLPPYYGEGYPPYYGCGYPYYVSRAAYARPRARQRRVYAR